MAESSHDASNSILSLPRGWSEAMRMTRYHPAYPILWEAPSDRAALNNNLSNLYDPWRFYSWATTFHDAQQTTANLLAAKTAPMEPSAPK